MTMTRTTPPDRRLGAVGALTLLAATTGAAVAAGPAGPRLGSPVQIIASQPNVPTAVNASSQAVTLRPESGPGPALQLFGAHGPARTIHLASATPGYNDPSVAIADSGALAVTWDTSSTDGSTPTVLEMAAGTFAAPPSNATPLAPATADVSGQQAYVNPRGTAIVVWTELDGTGPFAVRAAIVPSGSTPTPVTLNTNVTFVGAGLDGTGALLVVEQVPGGGLVGQSIAADGTVGSPVGFALPSGVGASRLLKLLVDGAGDQLYSWSSGLPGHEQLSAVWRSAAGVFGPVQALGADVGQGNPYSADVALNAAGRAVAVLEPASAGPLRVRFAVRLGRFAAPQSVGRVGHYANAPDIAIDGSARTLVTWIDSPASGRGGTAARAMVAQARSGRFTAPVVLPVQAGLGHNPVGNNPLAAAAPGDTPELVTYGVARGSRSVGEVVYLRG